MDIFIAKKRLQDKATAAGVVNADRKARYIFEHFTGFSQEDIYLYGKDIEIAPWKYAQMSRAVDRLIAGIPVQLIIGYTHFYDDIFLCAKGVLIPRPETETLVDLAIAEIDKRKGPLKILDIFTGSGIVAISLAKKRPLHAYFGADLSRKAINLARKNSPCLDVKIDWRVGDMFAPFAREAGTFDIITANPPYIASRDLKGLPLDVRLGDPREALDGGKDGLKFHKRLVDEAPSMLKPGGVMIVEMGYDQKKDIQKLYPRSKVKFYKDIWKKDRVYIVNF